ncbi:hypothetical protein [Alienimonas californiensis]|uniref:Uncharacterized protein n=1 Tax=Alienimonas californiensis TaxID=2527989 RepID=A0A517PDG2_9PLAN|nr:hypothetical protein [Alienimonas californiensis]QDT17425.1 hypothetical protein CA12_35470 [Alienimonas californiensis]
MLLLAWNQRLFLNGFPPPNEVCYWGWAGLRGASHHHLGGLVAAVDVSGWYLIPFPLLWSGVNLWRWVRWA